MKRYKVPGGGLHSVPDDGSQDSTITAGMVAISEAQFQAMSAAVVEAPGAADVKLAADATAARQYAKLQALINMTPAQVQAWVIANVTTLSAAQDAITTLAVAVSILGRKL